MWRLDSSGDARLLASGSFDGSVMLWNYATAQVDQRYEKHMGWVFDITFSPNGVSAIGRLRISQAGRKQIATVLISPEKNVRSTRSRRYVMTTGFQ